jgi:hypothetical protein
MSRVGGWRIPKDLLTAGRIVGIFGGRDGMKFHVKFFTKDLERGVDPSHENYAEAHGFGKNNDENTPEQRQPPKGGFQYNGDVTVLEAGQVVSVTPPYTTLLYRLSGLEPAERGIYSNVPQIPLNRRENNGENRNRRTVRIGPVPVHPRRGSTAGFGNGPPAAAASPKRNVTRRKPSPQPRKPAIRRHSTAGFGAARPPSPPRERRGRGGTVVNAANVGL